MAATFLQYWRKRVREKTVDTMPLTSGWPGWGRSEADYLSILLLELIGKAGRPLTVEQMDLELDRTNVTELRLPELLDDLVAAGFVEDVELAKKMNQPPPPEPNVVPHPLTPSGLYPTLGPGFPSKRGPVSELYSITAAGRRYLVALRSRRADLPRRNGAARAALLDWLYAMKQLGQEWPAADGFSRDPRCWFEGQPLPEAAINDTAKHLKDLGMIEGTSASGNVIPRLHLTSDGIDCVEHFGGAIQAWRQETRQRMTIKTGGGDYISHSNNIQSMRNSPGSQQVQGESTITAAEAKEVQDLTSQIRRFVQMPDVAADDREKVIALLDELETTVSQPNPDSAEVRSVWDKIKAVLNAAGPALNWIMTKMVLPGVFGE